MAFKSLATLSLLSALANLGAMADSSSDCNCYSTNGSTPAYFTDHMFFDFRDLSKYAGRVPGLVTDFKAAAESDATSDYFTSKDWTDTWAIQSWNNDNGNGKPDDDAGYLMANSLSNIYIQADNETHGSTYMTMRSSRLAKFQAAAEFQSVNSNFKHVSLRMLARTLGSPGAVTAMFTYRPSEKLADIQEADIEILTSGPKNKIQYTNQPSYTETISNIPEATRNATLPDDKLWTDWIVHRLDWTEGHSVWYVDSDEVAHIEFQAPKDACGINFNVWGNGGSWSQKMPVGGQAVMQVKWIEMVYNTTAEGIVKDGKRKRADSGCTNVCSVDEEGTPGQPKSTKDSGAAPKGGVALLTSLFTLAAVCWLAI